MALVRCQWSSDTTIVVVSETTGQRYVFTPVIRELEVDEADVEQFRAIERKVSSRGCCGGKGTRDLSIKVFQIIDKEEATNAAS